MNEMNHWHPVCLSQDLGPSARVGVTLLDTALVVWRSAAGFAHAWADQCPHRGAALSLGCVRGERLQCGYHGWEFAADGACAHVPATPGHIPRAGVASIFECLEAYGLVWVRLQSKVLAKTHAQASTPPAFPEFSHAHLRKVHCGPYDVETSAPRVVENFLDMAHFGFIHPNILGDVQHAAVPDYQVVPFDDARGQGVIATGCFAYQPKSNATIEGDSMVEYTYRVPAPYTSILTKIPQAQSGFEEAIALFVSPTSHERSRVWFVLAMSDFESTDATLRSFQDTIFAQDRPIVESQSPKRLPLDLRAEAHCAADKMSSAYRKYLLQHGVQCGVISAAAPG